MDSTLARESDYAHYLWHLHDAGVISLILDDANEPPRYSVSASVWDSLYDTPGPTSLVAVIDNGCTTKHPYLPKTGSDAALGGLLEAPDFATHDYGATVAPLHDGVVAPPVEASTTGREGRKNHFDTANAADGGFWPRIADFDTQTGIAGLSDIIGALQTETGVV